MGRTGRIGGGSCNKALLALLITVAVGSLLSPSCLVACAATAAAFAGGGPLRTTSRWRSSSPQLFYRNRQKHEDELTSTAAAQTAEYIALREGGNLKRDDDVGDSDNGRRRRPSPAASAAAAARRVLPSLQSFWADSTSANGIDAPMFRSLCASQLLLFLLAAAVVAAIGFATQQQGFLALVPPTIASSAAAARNSGSFGTQFFAATTAAAPSAATTLLVSFAQGIAAAVPAVYASRAVEASTDRNACHVNFATTNLVATLFGRRRRSKRRRSSGKRVHQSVVAGATDASEEEEGETVVATTTTAQMVSYSLALTTITGFCEETVFRWYVPAVLFALTHSAAVAVLGQAALFGIGHWHHASYPGENRVVVGLQTANGIWHGLVFMLAGGTLLPCIVSHAVYDAHVFMSTWKQVNDHLDWMEDETWPPDGNGDAQSNIRNGHGTAAAIAAAEEEAAIRRVECDAGRMIPTETVRACRRCFRAFDSDRVGSLSLDNVQCAISFAFLNDHMEPSEEDVETAFRAVLGRRDEEGSEGRMSFHQERLDFVEFLRLLLALRSLVDARQEKKIAFVESESEL